MKRFLYLPVVFTLLILSGCKVYYGDKMQKPKFPEATYTPQMQVYTTDISVTVDGIPVEAYEIDGKTVIALEDLKKCDFQENTRFEGEAFDMISGYSGEYEGNSVEPQIGGILAGQTTPSNDTVRVNGVKIANVVFDGKHYVSVDKLGEMDDPYNEEWGYSDYNMRLSDNGSEKKIECFRFPKVDAGANLAAAEPMVADPEIDLYTEGDISETKHYGGKFEPQSGVFAGINGDGNGYSHKEKKPFFDHDFSCYSNYIEFDYMQDEIFYPNKKIVKKKDCIMLVPWNTEDITLARDENYQDYIQKTLDNLKKYNRPVIIRFACEMNIGEMGNSPSAYVKSFRHIADIVHEYGYAVMWSPNDMGSLNKSYADYYPGDEYVDWIGISSFMKKDFMSKVPTSRGDAILFNCGDYGYHTNAVKYILKFMEENNIQKPLAISEGAVISSASYEGAPKDYTKWAYERLGNMYWYLPMRYPQIKMVTYFNQSTGAETIGFWLKDKEDYVPVIDDALKNAPYLLKYSDSADYCFVKAEGREYKNSEIPLYTYLYIPGEGGHSVEYSIDGEVFDRLDTIPYKTFLKADKLTEGEHVLEITVDGDVMKEYTVTVKNGSVTINNNF